MEEWKLTQLPQPHWWRKFILLKFADDLYIEFKSIKEFQ